MALMAFGDNEVTTSYFSIDKDDIDDDDDNDDNVEVFMLKLHDSYAKNKELKIKLNTLLNENSNC